MPASANSGLLCSNVPGCGPGARARRRARGRAAALVDPEAAASPGGNFSPSSRPSCANVVLHDCDEALLERAAALLAAEVLRSAVRPAAAGSSVDARERASSASAVPVSSAAVGGHDLERRAGRVALAVRAGERGLSGRRSAASKYACTAFVSWPASGVGSKLGFEYIATIAAGPRRRAPRPSPAGRRARPSPRAARRRAG